MEQSRSSLDLKAPDKKEEGAPQSASKPIVTGKVERRRNIIGDFVNTLVNEQDGTPRSQYIMKSVVEPAVKKTIMDILQNIGNGILGAVEVALFGTRSRPVSSGPGGYRYSYVDYTQAGRNSIQQARQVRSNPDDLIFRGPDAEMNAKATKAHLQDLIDACGTASLLDLHECLNEPTDHTDDNYGWFSLQNATISQVYGGWCLRLPRPVYLNRSPR